MNKLEHNNDSESLTEESVDSACFKELEFMFTHNEPNLFEAQ